MVVENVATFKVHKVKDGPYQDEEDGIWWLLCWVEDCNPVEDIDGLPVTIDNEGNACLLEGYGLEPDPDDAMFDEEVPFSTFTNAYNFKKHFESSIDPILIEFRAGMEIKYDG